MADALSASSYDFTYGGTYSVKSDGTYSDSTARYVVGAGGAVRIGSGIGPYLGVSVAVAAPSLTGSGVFLNPEGVVNAGSWAPFTAGIAPGEFIALVGTGLAPDGLPVASAVPFPTTLGPVQVMINGVAAPIYYATPNLIEAIVPYETTGSIAQIQVINNGATSNTVTTFISLTAPGVFTQNQNGLGYGSIQHSDYSLVTPSNPAQPGETLQVYLTGLGAVSPTVADGAAAPAGALTTGTITASIGGATATVSYAGLVAGAVSLYQVNVQVPSAATSGDNLLAISGPDSYSVEATIPVGTASGATAAPPPVTPRFTKPRTASTGGMSGKDARRPLFHRRESGPCSQQIGTELHGLAQLGLGARMLVEAEVTQPGQVVRVGRTAPRRLRLPCRLAREAPLSRLGSRCHQGFERGFGLVVPA